MTAPILASNGLPLPDVYRGALFYYANTYLLQSLIPTQQARLDAWVADARARGVHEANIIAVLTPWNRWLEAIANLADVTIPQELQRVQAGGAVDPQYVNVDGFNPPAEFKATAPPVLPNIDELLVAQGGALTGEARYTGPISPIVGPPVTLPGTVTPADQQLTTEPTSQAGGSALAAANLAGGGAAAAVVGASGPTTTSKVLLGLGVAAAVLIGYYLWRYRHG